MGKKISWIKCISAILCAEAVCIASSFLSKLMPQGRLGDNLYEQLVYLTYLFLMAIGLISILCLFKRKDVLFSRPKGSLITGCSTGIILISYATYMLITNLLNGLKDHGTPSMSPLFMFLYIIGLFMGAGIGEEFIFRGIFMNFIRSAAGNDTRKGLIIGMAVSSIFFGLLHLTNLEGNPDVTGTIGQVIYAIGIGFYLAAIYARTKNIWFNILLHFYVDISALLKTLFTNRDVSISEVIGGDPLQVILRSVLICVAFGGLGLFIIRKSKMPELT